LVQQRGVPEIMSQWLSQGQDEIVEQGVQSQDASYHLMRGNISLKHPLLSHCFEALSVLVPPEYDPHWTIVVRDGQGKEWSFGTWWELAGRSHCNRFTGQASESLHSFVGASKRSSAHIMLIRGKAEDVDLLCSYLVSHWSDTHFPTSPKLSPAE